MSIENQEPKIVTKEILPAKTEKEVLQNKVESGEISQERLQLAAFLGDESAREAVGFEEQSIDTMDDWVFKIRKFGGDEALSRIAMSSARFSLPVLQQGHAMNEEYRGIVENTEMMSVDTTTMRDDESNDIAQNIVTSEVADNTYTEKNAAKSIIGAHKVVGLMKNTDKKGFNRDLMMHSTVEVVKSAIQSKSPEAGNDRAGDSFVYSDMLKDIAKPVIDWALKKKDPVQDNIDHTKLEQDKQKNAEYKEEHLGEVREDIEEKKF